jgi:pyrroline-5-carboxylate reductase
MQPQTPISILLIGCGKMGSAMLKGWLQRPELFPSITVIDPAPMDHLGKRIKTPKNITELKEFSFDICVLAIKPQQMDACLKDLKNSPLQCSFYLSIVAAKPLNYIKENLGKSGQYVRAMPNLPASIGKGITACVGIGNAPKEAKEKAKINTLLEPIGSVLWLADEEDLHAVTALSGSGPAYVFSLLEAMSLAGEKMGLTPEISKQLATQTLLGSAELAHQSPESASILKDNVTSKNGTTQAARDILERNNQFQNLMMEAIKSAQARSQDLAKE